MLFVMARHLQRSGSISIGEKRRRNSNENVISIRHHHRQRYQMAASESVWRNKIAQIIIMARINNENLMAAAAMWQHGGK